MSDPNAAPGPAEGRSGPSFQVAIRLEWDEGDDVPIVYANQVQVAHGGPEFFLVFGVLTPPANPGHLPDALKIQPQARVVIAREAMPGIVQALNQSLERLRASQARAEAQSPPRDDPG